MSRNMEDGTGRLGLKRQVFQSLRQGVLRKSPTSRLAVCCGGVCLLHSSPGMLTELVRAGEVTQRRDVRGPPGADQTVGKCRQSLDQSGNQHNKRGTRTGRERPTRRCHGAKRQWIHFNHATTPASVLSDVPSVPTQTVCCFRWAPCCVSRRLTTVYCGGLLMGEDVQKHLGLTCM